MKLALSQHLRERPGPAQRFLRAAVALDTPGLSPLVEAGVPHWDATDYLRRLAEAGEVTPQGWQHHIRDAYRQALTEPAASRTIELLPPGERPREKALERGVDALGDAELLAVLLRTGLAGEGVLELAARLLAEHGGLVGLARLSTSELARLSGLGPAKATELAAAFAIGARLAASPIERIALDNPEAVEAYVRQCLSPQILRLPHEELWCLPLDPRLRLIGRPQVVTRGDVDGTDAGPRSFFRVALAAGATQAIAVHNHPGGDPSPSAADHAVTRRLVAAGRALDLPLRDHLIIGAGGRWCSLRRDATNLFL